MGNTNSLPVALMHSLARDPGSRAVLDPTAKDADEVARRGIAFVLFFSLFSNILRWTVCYHLLAKEPGEEDVDVEQSRFPTSAYQEEPQPIGTPEEYYPGDVVIAEIPDTDPKAFATRCRRRSRIFEIASDELCTESSLLTEETPLLSESPVCTTLPSLPTPKPSRLYQKYLDLVDLMNAPLYAAFMALYFIYIAGRSS